MKNTADTPENIRYTKEELLEKLDQMTKASNAFYAMAVRIGVHPFIEFTGLMNEYIKVAHSAVQRHDLDFTIIHNDSSTPMPMEKYEVEYLMEKLECIYGSMLRDNRKIVEEALGWD